MTYRHYRWLLCSLAVLGLLASNTLVRAITSAQGSSSWTNPTAKTLLRIGPATDITQQSNFQANIDCSVLTYRQVAETTMRTGCFMSTAYGLVDIDQSKIIFSGTDEALPLITYGSNQVLTPWPRTSGALALNAANTGGSYVSLYKNLLPVLEDKRNAGGALIAKEIIGPPDIPLKDMLGNKLVINAQSVAFSDNASWLVAESMNGSFIRINLSTLEITPFAVAYGSQGSPALLKSQVSVTNDGRYVAIQNNLANSFKVYDVSSCQGVATIMAPLQCDAYEYWPFISGQLAQLKSINHVRFINNELLTFNAVHSGGTDTYKLAPSAVINSSLEYLALGDSYTSGEGAFDYLYGTDTDVNHCHLSANSYPLLISRQLFGASGGHTAACSGGKIQDISPNNLNNYRGQVSDGVPRHERQTDNIRQLLANYIPGYLPQEEFVGHYQPRRLTISVGGNDVGFGAIVQSCVQPHLSLLSENNTCFSSYEDRLEIKQSIDRTVPRLVALYRQLIKKSPGSKFYAIGYPQVITGTGSCGLNVHLNKSEIQFAQGLIDYINAAVRLAANQASIDYVDISEALAGHKLCEASSYAIAVNGVTAGKDSGLKRLKFLGSESYHPNSLGHELLGQAIMRQTNNLEAKTNSVTNFDSESLLAAPKTNRLINNVKWSDSMVSESAGTKSLSIRVNGSYSGLRPNSGYAIRINGPQGTVIKQVTSNSSGDINTEIAVAEEDETEIHSIDVTGSNQVGERIDIRQPVYLTTPSADNPAPSLGQLSTIKSGVTAAAHQTTINQRSAVVPSSHRTSTIVKPAVYSAPTNQTRSNKTLSNPGSVTPKLYPVAHIRTIPWVLWSCLVVCFYHLLRMLLRTDFECWRRGRDSNPRYP